MADSQFHINEPVIYERYLDCVYSEYSQPTTRTFPLGSASNSVVIPDDDPSGSALNPVVIPDDEPLNPHPPSQIPALISEDLANAGQDQSSAFELEDYPSSDSVSDSDSDSDSALSQSSRPSSSSGSSVASDLSSITSQDCTLDQPLTTDPPSIPETLPTPGASSTPGLSPTLDQPSALHSSSTSSISSLSNSSTRSSVTLASDASPPTSPLSDVSLLPYAAFRWDTPPQPELPPWRHDSRQPSPARIWNEIICSKCKQRGHDISAHCRTCGEYGHPTSQHCTECQQIGHNVRDHCVWCTRVAHCTRRHCSKFYCKSCKVTGHRENQHCSQCSSVDHDHYHHCKVCDVVFCQTKNHCYVCGELGHSSKDHCEKCKELGHKGDDHCLHCKELGHNFHECSKQAQGRFCWICREQGHHNETCLSRKQYELREKWAFKRLERPRYNKTYCECCLEIREPGYSFHQKHKLANCPKLTHKIACLKKDHDNVECLEWIQRLYRNAATQVNLAELSTDVDLRYVTKGKEKECAPSPIPLSVFSAVSSSAQTDFHEVRVGLESHHRERLEPLTLNQRLPVEEKAKTLEVRDDGTQYCETKCGDDSTLSTRNEGTPERNFPRTLDDDQQTRSKDHELTRLGKEVQYQSDVQKAVQQTMLETTNQFDVEGRSLNSDDSHYSHPPTSPSCGNDVHAHMDDLTDNSSSDDEGSEDDLPEEADMHVFQTPCPDPQISDSMEIAQADTQQNDSSSSSQEVRRETSIEYFDEPFGLESCPVSSDRSCSPSVTRILSLALDIQMDSHDAFVTPAPTETAICNTAEFSSTSSSNDAMYTPCPDGRDLIAHERRSGLMGGNPVRKRKHKPRKAHASKKQKSDSNPEIPNAVTTDGTMQDHAIIEKSQGVSLAEGLDISWRDLCYTVMLEAPNHSSNFKQLCNLIPNWLRNTFPSIDFDINQQDMMENLQAVVANSPNFELCEPGQRKNPVEISIREDAIKKVKIVVSCFKAKLARPEYHHKMAIYLLPKSKLRPELSFEKLIGMALHALKNKHVEEMETVTWISAAFAGYQTVRTDLSHGSPKYFDKGDWVLRSRKELRASSFFKKRISESGDEEWRFRKGCAEYFREWDESLHWLA